MNPKIRIQLSVMMFIQFFIWGVWFVPMGPYLGKTLLFPPDIIGYAYSTMYVAAMVSPFFVGMVADRFFNAERVLGVLHILGGVALYAASQVTTPAAFIGILLLHALCYMPTLALINAVSFNVMENPGQQFPGVRVLGTIGWIVAGLLIGNLGLATTAQPLQWGAVASILLGIYCFVLLPATPPRSRGERVTVREVLGLDALRLMKDRSFAVFVISSFFVCIPLSFYYAFGNIFLEDAGMANATAKLTMGQMSEIFFMLVMPFFFARLGVKWMLFTGMLFWTARYILFALGNAQDLVWMLYLAILFHGICYDFFFVTGQIYTDMKAPEKIRANAQGFLTFVTLGVGMVIGTFLSGWIVKFFTLVDDLGEPVGYQWRQIWLTPAAMAAIVMVLFVLIFKDNGKRKPSV